MRGWLVLFCGLAWLALSPAIGVAMHGGGGTPVVESERFAAGADESGAGTCRVAGSVQNPSLSETVTVRLTWRGLNATGTPVAVALARIAGLRPGERRPFTSSPFVATNSGEVVSSCQSIPYLERVEVVVDPMRTPGG